jgi:hypothetical protein
MKFIQAFLTFTAAILCLTAPAHAKVKQRDASEKKTTAEAIRTEAGLNIPEWGIAIDASYDPRLTDLIPGYHIVNIVLTNRRPSPLLLDPTQDRWIIVDSLGKKHTAKNHVKLFDKDLWAKLPEPLKQRLDYPHAIKSGNFTTLDVFIPKSIDLFNFREVQWKSANLNKEFSIYTNYEKSLSLGGDNKNEKPLPQSPHTQTFTAEDYMKTREEVLNGDKWRTQDQEEKEAEEKSKSEINFDPSFDDAIIIR